jgi:uracil DNA glycosylase superfamily protein
MPESAASLLVRITRCPVAERCRAGEDLACSAVVGSQGAPGPGDYQVPEPWSGHISGAPVLFVSSNPSIDPAEAYPAGDWDDERRIDFFADRFDQRDLPWVDQRMRPLLQTSPRRHRDHGTRFWAATRARASELLGRQAEPGRDFALTEVVHCKSRAEHGVAEALATCAETWLHPTIRVAVAPVVVLFGARAREAFSDTFAIPAHAPVTGPLSIEGTERIVVQLPHPNARSQRRNCYPLTSSQLDQVRQYLRTHRHPAS